MTQVLADTTVWVRHFRRADAVLQSLLATDRILGHPLIVLELACGTPPAPRDRTLRDLRALRALQQALDLLLHLALLYPKAHRDGCDNG